MSKFADVRRGHDTLLPKNIALCAESIGKRSITPTTHKHRDAFKDTLDMQGAMATVSPAPTDMQDCMFYQDTYYHLTFQAEVLHFGINGHYAPMRSALALHNTAQQQKMVAASISAASNASKPSEYPKFVQQVTPTQYEQDLIQCAVQHLVTTGQKTVLVDTFPRALKPDVSKSLSIGDIEIPLTTESLPTHAVVLYKNSHGQILVIDPNSPQFSGHLQHVTTAALLVSNNLSPLHKPYASKAVSTPPNTGPDKAKYRDCVDIAVKLAALLEQDTADYTSHDLVMKSRAVALVSNNKDITGLEIDQPLRIKQVSHLGKIHQINDNLLKQKLAYDKSIEDAQIKFKAEQQVLKQKYDAEFSRISTDYDSDVSALIGQVASDPALEGSYA